MIGDETRAIASAFDSGRKRAMQECEIVATSRSETIRAAGRALRDAFWTIMGILAAVLLFAALVLHFADQSAFGVLQLALWSLAIVLVFAAAGVLLTALITQRYTSSELWDVWTQHFLEAAKRSGIPGRRAKYLFALGTYQRRFWLNLFRGLWTPASFLAGVYFGREVIDDYVAGIIRPLPFVLILLLACLLFVIQQAAASVVYHREHLQASLDHYADDQAYN